LNSLFAFLHEPAFIDRIGAHEAAIQHSRIRRLPDSQFFTLRGGHFLPMDFFFLLTSSASTLNLSGKRTELRRDELIGHAHYLFSHTISFLFVGIAGLADIQFRLNMPAECVIADPLVQVAK
jgi:hypothetical protein